MEISTDSASGRRPKSSEVNNSSGTQLCDEERTTPSYLERSVGRSSTTGMATPFDITEAGVAVRYKVYTEKKRKPKIKYCIGFNAADPMPERELYCIACVH